MVLVQLLTVSYSYATPVSLGDMKIVEGELCPSDYRHITIEEAKVFKRKLCSSIQPSEIVWLENHAAIGGVEHDCMIFTQNDNKPSTPSASICQKPIECDASSELIIAPGAHDYCAEVGDTRGFDINHNNICTKYGRGNFIGYKYLYTKRSRRPDDESKIKTAMCEENDKPLKNVMGEIVACPYATEFVKGMSSEDHCAYIWNEYIWEEKGLDYNGNSICKNYGGFEEYIYRVQRRIINLQPSENIWEYSYFRRDFYAPDGSSQTFPTEHVLSNKIVGQRTLICQKEERPRLVSKDKFIDCPSYDEYINGLRSITSNCSIECPLYSEFVKGHSVKDHCALKGGDLGYDINNEINFCKKEGKGFPAEYVINEEGVKTLICEKEYSSNIIATKNKQEKSGIECPKGTEFIDTNKYQPRVQPHCKMINGAPGTNEKGVDICAKAGSKFEFYEYPKGIKTLKCNDNISSSGTGGHRAETAGGNVR